MKKMLLLSLGFAAVMGTSLVAMENETDDVSSLFKDSTIDFMELCKSPFQTYIESDEYVQNCGNDSRLRNAFINDNDDEYTQQSYLNSSYNPNRNTTQHNTTQHNTTMSLATKAKITLAVICLAVAGKYAFFNGYDLGIQSRIISFVSNRAGDLAQRIGLTNALNFLSNKTSDIVTFARNAVK